MKGMCQMMSTPDDHAFGTWYKRSRWNQVRLIKISYFSAHYEQERLLDENEVVVSHQDTTSAMWFGYGEAYTFSSRRVQL